ncbi:leader peptidase (prepilin peptidase)/N-methyltransferase [Crossiella equi]|uniref:Leader peptidase (Prepilin peptidase)/N-methyltransferase n=1 Tax=Crossiella equi TaxID=130796 RepID=A0ABS5A8J0_9PSEU|nr:A24 family peptidase [Crossiella equi]MBP2472919.1 leader peptidase (prepilin peptidase)/N-methyltransferase [Crossiella equi]
MGLLAWSWVPVPVLLAWFGVPLAFADLRHRRLPDCLTLSAVPAFALLFTLLGTFGPDAGIAGRAFLGAGVFFGIHLLVHLIRPAALGGGDVKLSATVGAVAAAVSWPALMAVALGAMVGTALVAVVWRGPPGDDGVPHGPGMLGATWLATVLAGQGALFG